MLRGIEAANCPECGTELDPNALTYTRIPWEHRRWIGPIDAWWRTLLMVTFKPLAVAEEVRNPLDLSAAKRFALITTLIASVPSILVLLTVFYYTGETSMIAPTPGPTGSAMPVLLPGPLLDVVLPWAAGITLWPVLPVAVFVLFYLLCHATAALHPRKSRAIGFYSTAPFGWISLPLAATSTGTMLILSGIAARQQFMDIASALQVLGGLVVIITLIIAFAEAIAALNSARKAQGVAHKPIWVLFSLTFSWIVMLIIATVILPWVVGYFWLIIDSYRA